MSNAVHTYEIIDRRGTKPDLMPHQAFALVHKIDGITVFTQDCYTVEEAERARQFRLARHNDTM